MCIFDLLSLDYYSDYGESEPAANSGNDNNINRITFADDHGGELTQDVYCNELFYSSNKSQSLVSVRYRSGCMCTIS